MTKNNLLNSLTYGFEIEGAFTRSLVDNLKAKRLGKFTQDGSVRVNPSACEKNWVEEVQEFQSRVFKTRKGLFQVLSAFKFPNYDWDYSCGLHFHLKAKEEELNDRLWSLVCNQKFLFALTKKVKGFCLHQTERLTYHRHFCQNYPIDTQYLLRQYHNGEKFRTVRFHPEYDTLEFRLLTPCPHKTANIKKLLRFLTAYLLKVERKKQRIIIDEKMLINKQNYVLHSDK